jgi:hypothetical protein
MGDKDWEREKRRCKRVIADEEDAFIRRHCFKKRGHNTLEEATQECDRLKMKYGTNNLTVYLCSICEKYKVGRTELMDKSRISGLYNPAQLSTKTNI